MSLDDLARNRQAETRVLAEARALRTRGIKALEDSLQIILRNAGTVILEHNARRPHRIGITVGERDADLAAFRGEGAGIIDDIAEDLAERPFAAIDQRRGRRQGTLEANGDLAGDMADRAK